MNMTDIVQLIGSLGFPIVACGALFWMLNKQQAEHHEETSMIREAINELKAAIIELTSKLNQ